MLHGNQINTITHPHKLDIPRTSIFLYNTIAILCNVHFYSSCLRLEPLYFLANFWFRRNLGSIPRVETNLDLLAFLIPLACALWVLLCAQVFFCCCHRKRGEYRWDTSFNKFVSDVDKGEARRAFAENQAMGQSYPLQPRHHQFK